MITNFYNYYLFNFFNFLKVLKQKKIYFQLFFFKQVFFLNYIYFFNQFFFFNYNYFLKLNYFFFFRTMFLKKKNNIHFNILFNNWFKLKKKNLIFISDFNTNKLSKLIFQKNEDNFEQKNKFYDLKKRSFYYLNENLKLVKFFFLKKFSKTKNIKKFIHKTKAINKQKFYLIFELMLFNCLLRSLLIQFFNDVFYFIKNGLVFVNGLVIKNPYYITNVGDKIQLIILKNFYYFYIFKKSLLLKYLFKIKIKIWALNKSKINYYKQVSSRVQNNVINTMFYYIDIPKYMEVDFSLLMIILLFRPKNYFLYNIYILKFFSNYMFRLLIWNK